MTQERPITEVHSREGAICIYAEDTFIQCAKIHSIVTNDWGIRASFTAIKKPELKTEAIAEWEVASNWEQFFCRGDGWVCLSMWRIMFNADMIKKICETLSNENAQSERDRLIQFILINSP